MIGGIELFKASKKVDLADFGREFEQFATTAVRLEMLPRYHMEAELGSLRDFLAGKPADFSFNSAWYSTIRAAKARGARMLHIRGLPDTVTPYLRFEFAAYGESQEAGEEFRFLFNHEIEEVVGADAALPDLWLFDRSRAYLILYDTRGGVLGVVSPDHAATSLICELVDKLMSVPPRSLEWVREQYDHVRS